MRLHVVIALSAIFLITALPATAETTPSDSVVVNDGYAWVYGNEMHAPYVLTLQSNIIYLNGVQIRPTLSFDPPQPLPPLPRDVALRSASRSALMCRADSLRTAWASQGQSWDDIGQNLSTMIMASGLAERAVVETDPPRLSVKFLNGPNEHLNLLPATGGSSRAIPLEQERRLQFNEVRQVLSSGGVIVITAMAGTIECVGYAKNFSATLSEVRQAVATSGSWEGKFLSASLVGELRNPRPINGNGR